MMMLGVLAWRPTDMFRAKNKVVCGHGPAMV